MSLIDDAGTFEDLLLALQESVRKHEGGMRSLAQKIGLDIRTDFQGMDLAGANFRGEDLSGFDFTDADLSGADLRDTGIRSDQLVGAALSGTLFGSAHTRRYPRQSGSLFGDGARSIVRRTLSRLTADIASAYISNNIFPASDLPLLIQGVHRALSGLNPGGEAIAPVNQEPAVPVRRSITADYLVCLEDGRKFKSLKRHLRTKYNMSPEDYRAKWGLAKDYPMVAPSYSKLRSDRAKQMSLGWGGRQFARKVR